LKRKRWSEDEKVAIVLEAIRGETPVEEIARREGVSATQIFKWREAFIEAGRQGLKDRRTANGRDPVAYENRRLKEMVGQQTLIIETQKKLAGMPTWASDGSR
jgi:transposase-like protein